MAAQIQPLDANGNPNAGGKIVMISVGMSNTTQEFSSAGTGNFKARADADPAKNPQLIIVDGAPGRPGCDCMARSERANMDDG